MQDSTMASNMPQWGPEATRLLRLLNDEVLPLAGYTSPATEEAKNQSRVWNWLHPPSDLNKHFLQKWEDIFATHAMTRGPIMVAAETGEPELFFQSDENGEMITLQRFEAEIAAMKTESKQERDQMYACIQMRNEEFKALAAQHDTTAHDIYLHINARARAVYTRD